MWLLVAASTDRAEAWDSPAYFRLGYPALMLASVVLGYAVPERVWRWGVIPFAAQAALALAQNPTAGLLPLGLIVFAVLSVPAVACARIGAALRRLDR